MLFVAVASVVGCARVSESPEAPSDAEVESDAEVQANVEVQADADASVSAEMKSSEQQVWTPPRRPIPNLPDAKRSKGFEPIEVAIVWSCEAQYIRFDSGALVRSQAELEASIDLQRIGSFCEGAPPPIDFDTHALVAVELEFQASLSHASARKSALEFGVGHSLYCGGAQPPGPTMVFVEVPASSKTARIIHGAVQGKCTGPAMP